MTDSGSNQSGFDRSAYDYMDSMGLDGWIWEFIRRNDDYRKAHDELHRINSTPSYGKDNMFRRGEIWDSVEERFGISTPRWTGDDNSAVSSPYETGIPNPCIRYTIIPYNEKPLILKDSIITTIHNEELKREIGRTMRRLSKKFHSFWDKDKQKALSLVVSNLLSPRIAKDTLYIGIDCKAKRTDLQEKIKAILEENVKPRNRRGSVRFRPDDWKQYLQVFDAKKKMTHKEIANIFFPYIDNSYPDRRGEKESQKCMRKARELIKEKYKRFLL